jgi:hypothetical protein
MDGDPQSVTPDTPPVADPAMLAMMGGGGAPQPPQMPPPQVSQAPPTPSGMPTDPNTIEAVAAGVHHDRMAGALKAVTDLMGGSTTVHLTKHPDGSLDITHDPSTSGEKWQRIAAAALAGATKGFAAGTGPGGMARAAGVGFDAGQQVQKAPEQAAQEQAEIADKRLQDHANLVLTQQRLVSQTLANKQAGITLSKEQQDQANDEADRYGNSPNSTYVGAFGSMAEAAKSPNAQLLLKNHPYGTLRVVNAYDGSGNITGVHAYVVDKAWGDRMNDHPVSYLEQVPNDDPNAKPQFKQSYIPVNGKTNQDADTWVQAHNGKAAEIQAAWAKQQEAITARETAAAREKREEAMQPYDIAAKRASTSAENAETALRGTQNEIAQNTLKQRPGGEPTEVEDPRYPPPNNFPVGTIGIAPAPKSGSAVPPTAAEAYRLKNIMQGSGALIRQTATQNPQLFGRLQGLLSQGKTIVGLSDSKDDQALATLAGSIQQYAQASAGFHKFRNKAAPAETEESSLNKFRNSPAAIVAYLDSQAPAFAETDHLIRNYEVYHTPDGPSPEARAAALARAPNAAKFAPGGGGPPAGGGGATQFVASPNQPSNPPHPGYVYGTGPQGTGWYPPQPTGGR